MYAALLFDNDGVLVDTEGLYFQATREVLAGLGVTLTEDHYRQLFLVESRGAWHLAGIDDEATLAALKQRRNQRYLELIATSEVEIPAAVEAIPLLAAHYRLALVTSSERAPFERAHRQTGLLPQFELVLAQGDYRASKPDPAPYLTALARLGLPPERCLVIEDSERGLHAAKAAGLECWILPSPLTRPFAFAGADRVLGGWGELLSRLLPGN